MMEFSQVNGRIVILPLFLNLSRKMLSQIIVVLLSVPILSKVLERQAHTRLCQHVSGFLYSQQHGFRKQRSCITQLLQFAHTMAKSLDDDIHTDVIYLDMAKTFDKVPHEKLLYKLEMVGVRDPLLAWLRSYLANRRHRTVIDGFASDWRYVPSGVPQGPIIRPLLFLIFINDIADDISTDTSIPLYADDAKCYRKLLDPADHAILQSDLNKIVDWSELWGMSYNASKCKHLSLTKKAKAVRNNIFSWRQYII